MLKKLLYILLSLVLIVVLAAVAFVNFVDPNDFKPLIVKEVKTLTNRDLSIDGNIGWQFWPNLGVSIENVSLSNPEGFAENSLAKFSKAEVSVAVMPLLSNKIDIGVIRLHDARFFMQTLVNGSNNLDGILANNQAVAETQTPPSPETDLATESSLATEQNATSSSAWQLSIGEIDIQNASALIRDDIIGSQNALTALNLSIGKYVPNTTVPVKLTAHIAGKSLPNEALDISFTGDVQFDRSKKIFDANNLALAINNMQMTGKASAELSDVTKVRFDFTSEEINLDEFIGASVKEEKPANQETAGTTSTTESGDKNAPATDVEPDLSALKGLDIAGKIAINHFIASNIKVSDVLMDFAIDRGKVALKQFDASLYEGKISATAMLDATLSPAQYSVVKSIKDVAIAPLIMDAAGKNILAGKGNIEINLTGQGLSEARLLPNLKGNLSTSLNDGAIMGINVVQIMREAKALLKGEKIPAAAAKQTDFSELVASLDLANGVATIKEMRFLSPAIRINNVGFTNLIDQSMDFTLAASVVETSKGQGAQEELQDLKGITVPVNIGGTWSNMTYGIDLKELLKSNLKQTTENKLKQKAQKELDRFFGEKQDDPIKKAAEGLLNKVFN